MQVFQKASLFHKFKNKNGWGTTAANKAYHVPVPVPVKRRVNETTGVHATGDMLMNLGSAVISVLSLAAPSYVMEVNTIPTCI